MQAIQNRVGFTSNLKQNKVAFGRRVPNKGTSSLLSDFAAEEKKRQANLRMINHVLDGILGASVAFLVTTLGAVAHDVHTTDVVIPKAERSLSAKVKDFTAAHKFFDNAKALKEAEGPNTSAKYLAQVNDSLDGKKVTPGKNFAASLAEGKKELAVLAKVDSTKAVTDSLLNSIGRGSTRF